MACSCKKKNITTQQIEDQAKVATTTVATKANYDFSTTTKPLQTCPYCASKHIDLALVLLQKNTIEDKLIAIGQLMAATYHYNTTHIFLTKQINQVLSLFIDNKFQYTQQIRNKVVSIADQAMQVTNLPDNTQKIPSTCQYSPKEALKHACLAFSLLFTQLFYQRINKAYAVGELILAALHLQQKDRARAKKLRQIWKVVQQIKEPNDQDYNKSRTMLMDFLKELQQSLIIIV